jgi:hypothetical protein
VHDGAAETRREEGTHDSACGFNRLLSLCRSEQSERIYPMRAEGAEQSSLSSGEKTGAGAWLRAFITKHGEDLGCCGESTIPLRGRPDDKN